MVCPDYGMSWGKGGTEIVGLANLRPAMRVSPSLILPGALELRG